jgi:hypothetical protein
MANEGSTPLNNKIEETSSKPGIDKPKKTGIKKLKNRRG